MNNKSQNNELKEGPILIAQKNQGEVFDFGILINKNNIDYFIGVQVGLNKTREDIYNCISKIENNNNRFIEDVSIVTKRKIDQFRFIIILSKERQDELKQEYDQIYIEINNSKEKTHYEKENLKS
jgi:hypothetical protein